MHNIAHTDGEANQWQIPVVTNFYKLRKSFDTVNVYLVRIFDKGSKNPIGDDEKLDEHTRYQIVQCGKGRPEINKKKRAMKRLFGPFYLFDNKQHFTIGHKVETVESSEFEDGKVVRFEFQYTITMDEVAMALQSNDDQKKESGKSVKDDDESKEKDRITKSTEPMRLLNLINRYRLQQAKFKKLSERGKAWFDERCELVHCLHCSYYSSFYIFSLQFAIRAFVSVSVSPLLRSNLMTPSV